MAKNVRKLQSTRCSRSKVPHRRRKASHPFATLLPDRPSPSLPTQGGEGARTDAQPTCRSTPVGVSEAPRGHWAKCLGTAGVCSKRRAGHMSARPSLALRHPWPPDLPSPSLPAQGAKGQEPMLNQRVGQLTTQRSSRSDMSEGKRSPRLFVRGERKRAALFSPRLDLGLLFFAAGSGISVPLQVRLAQS
jgi:hypothetical protein